MVTKNVLAIQKRLYIMPLPGGEPSYPTLRDRFIRSRNYFYFIFLYTLSCSNNNTSTTHQHNKLSVPSTLPLPLTVMKRAIKSFFGIKSKSRKDKDHLSENTKTSAVNSTLNSAADPYRRSSNSNRPSVIVHEGASEPYDPRPTRDIIEVQRRLNASTSSSAQVQYTICMHLSYIRKETRLRDGR